MGERESGGRDLLTIREAAEFLSVSIVSLRRWTNDGRLPCLRVGRRGERRFRRSDLRAVLEDRSRPSAGDREASAIRIEGVPVALGGHLCSIYESDLGRLKLSVPFLAEGLEGEDFCILVAAAGCGDTILERLERRCDRVAPAMRAGRFLVSQGADSAGHMFDLMQDVLVGAVTAGHRSIRLVGDMAWCLDAGVDVAELMDFERRYTHAMARQFPIVALCQYDARLFSGVEILDALKCHEDTFRYPLSRFLN